MDPTRQQMQQETPEPLTQPPAPQEKDICPATGRPISAGLRMLPQDAQDDFLMKRLKQEQRFAPMGERMKRRAIMYAIGGAVGLVFVNLMTPVFLDLILVQLLLGAIYGVCVAYLRPTGPIGGFAFLFVGVISMFVTGHPAILTSFRGAFACVLYFCAGLAVGIGETSKMENGE